MNGYCLANGSENEPECEHNPNRYDPETCITDGRCHWVTFVLS